MINIETTKLGIILSGSMEKTIFTEKTDYDFYHMKGIFESIFEKLNIKSYQIERSKHRSLHPGMSADVYIGRMLRKFWICSSRYWREFLTKCDCFNWI